MDILPFFSAETWTLLVTLVCLFVVYGYWPYGIFDKMGIPGRKPTMYFGTLGKHSKIYFKDDQVCFQKYGRIWGSYEFRRPTLAVMEPDMLKVILVKECFTYFTNRRNLRLNGELYDSVSIAEDDTWKRIRKTLSPSFNSGRIKEMFTIMKHHSRKLTDRLRSKVQEGDIISIKDFFGPYAMDVMASSALGVDIDSMNNPSSPYITHANKLFKFNKKLFILQGLFPFLLPVFEILGFSLFSKSSVAFFEMVLEKVKAERSKNPNTIHRDWLQYLMNTQKDNDHKNENQNTGLSDHEILSQATMFVFAGYETSAKTLVFLAYNLARHPDVLSRVHEEIDATFPNKAPVQYEPLMQMEYLDSVVSETLRLYPVAARMERVAKETVKVDGITIPKGMIIMVPVYTLHRDPEVWPDPEEFKPDRFSKENKQHINPYTYLPFGAGPRNCLGMRFALALIKLVLVEVLQNYTFSVCEETEIPLELDAEGLLGPLRPVKLKLMTRSVASDNVGNSN